MPRPDGQVVVTGAAGYLGGRVVGALGDAARALVRSPVSWLPDDRQRACDLLGPAADIADTFADASVVLHLAGHNEVIAKQDPHRATSETEAMARAVADAAQLAGVPRIVYVSTVHVYGEHLRPGAMIHEGLTPAPTSPYAEARRSCEQVLTSVEGVDTVVLRLTNAVGAPADPRVDRWTLVANDLCRQAILDQALVLHSAGGQWRDFIALDDACRIVVAALDPTTVPAGTFNLAAGRSATIRTLAGLVQDRVEHARGERPTLAAPPLTGEPEEPYSVDVSALGGLGLRAELALEDAVDEIIDHCIEHESWLRRGRTAS